MFYKRVTGSLFSRVIKGNSVLISSLKQSAEERKYSATLLARKSRAFLFHLKSIFLKSFPKVLSQNCFRLTFHALGRGRSQDWAGVVVCDLAQVLEPFCAIWLSHFLTSGAPKGHQGQTFTISLTARRQNSPLESGS